jgi:hypothetical protein
MDDDVCAAIADIRLRDDDDEDDSEADDSDCEEVAAPIARNRPARAAAVKAGAAGTLISE